MDDAYRLRARQEDTEDEITQSPTGNDSGAPCVVAVTVNEGHYPTSAQKFYAMSSQDVTGTETEGSMGTLTSLSDRFYAFNLGSGIPPVGTYVICTFCNWRWVFRYDQGSPPPPPAGVPGRPSDPDQSPPDPIWIVLPPLPPGPGEPPGGSIGGGDPPSNNDPFDPGPSIQPVFPINVPGNPPSNIA